ncbi:MAG: DUF1830 domain-containing protein [Leptolyngbyaceae cyanobacterium]
MYQVIDSVPADISDAFACCYVNASSKIQIVRVTNIANWYFERVVFPGQQLVFQAPTGALLEIHCGMMASAILSDMIPCERLRLSDEEVLPFELSLKQGNLSAPPAQEDKVESAEQTDDGSNVRQLMTATPVAS